MQKRSQLGKRKTVIGFINNRTKMENEKNGSSFLESYKRIALRFDDDPSIFFILVDNLQFPGFTKVYNIPSSKFPDVFIVNWIDSLNWTRSAKKKEQNWNEENIITFIHHVINGKVC
ncbi:MAG: hypothetical protein EZS28_030977 [Streblomastix strix]|uniref:Uncharacterized protein n=1 Tax=Streblomastix strix TaxID=222440 RepID=A0A5J4UUS3_9EUKA|nr:MAG: hypothetical protein EZS28_030977 [Streblomastix strix]